MSSILIKLWEKVLMGTGVSRGISALGLRHVLPLLNCPGCLQGYSSHIFSLLSLAAVAQYFSFLKYDIPKAISKKCAISASA